MPTNGKEDRSARILLVDSDAQRLHGTVERLHATGSVVLWAVQDRSKAVEAARQYQPEVAVVELAFRECDGPAVAFQIVNAARHTQSIFFGGPNDEGEMAAARDLGLGRVIPGSELFASLERILLPLAEWVRLRRRLDMAEQRLARASTDDVGCAGPRRVALPEAERRYRETYVRSLLAETGNRREAAKRAGVPYTTFCEIIRKLGIPDTPVDRPASQRD